MDAIVLQPGLDAIAARMSRCNVLATLVVTGPMVREASDEILRRIAGQPIGPMIAASPLRRGGVVLRIAGTSVEHVGHTLREHLNFLNPLIGGDFWSRKW
jgi:hypothetical protein